MLLIFSGRHLKGGRLICETVDCDISDVIQLEHEEKCTDSTGDN